MKTLVQKDTCTLMFKLEKDKCSYLLYLESKNKANKYI